MKTPKDNFLAGLYKRYSDLNWIESYYDSSMKVTMKVPT